ncbi:hypothetical protein SALBM217S_10034 [Streptomyces griseoloalbus]
MLLHSRYMRVITHPVFTIPMFIASLYALYFTPLFDFLMGSQVGHIAMMVHFLAVGLVFFWPIMGVLENPGRPAGTPCGCWSCSRACRSTPSSASR